MTTQITIENAELHCRVERSFVIPSTHWIYIDAGDTRVSINGRSDQIERMAVAMLDSIRQAKLDDTRPAKGR